MFFKAKYIYILFIQIYLMYCIEVRTTYMILISVYFIHKVCENGLYITQS